MGNCDKRRQLETVLRNGTARVVKYPFYIPMISRHASQSGILNFILAGAIHTENTIYIATAAGQRFQSNYGLMVTV